MKKKWATVFDLAVDNDQNRKVDKTDKLISFAHTECNEWVRRSGGIGEVGLLCFLERAGSTHQIDFQARPSLCKIRNSYLLVHFVIAESKLIILQKSRIIRATKKIRIDLQTCPLLLRVFLSNVRHHSPTDYSRGQVPSNELQVYTWMDASLRELTGLIKEVNREARKKGTVFDFALVYPDRNSAMYRFREIGSTVSIKTA